MALFAAPYLTSPKPEYGPNEVEAIMGVDFLPGAFAIDTEDAPQAGTRRAHPLLWEATGQTLPFGSHAAPVVFVSHRRPRSAASWEESSLLG